MPEWGACPSVSLLHPLRPSDWALLPSPLSGLNHTFCPINFLPGPTVLPHILPEAKDPAMMGYRLPKGS